MFRIGLFLSSKVINPCVNGHLEHLCFCVIFHIDSLVDVLKYQSLERNIIYDTDQHYDSNKDYERSF